MMAIYTKHGAKVINESLRIDKGCLSNGEIVKVWAIAEGEAIEKQYWFSDLHGDKRHELRDVIQANLRRGENL